MNDQVIIIMSLLLAISLLYVNAEVIVNSKKQHKKLSNIKRYYLIFNYIISISSIALIGLYFTL